MKSFFSASFPDSVRASAFPRNSGNIKSIEMYMNYSFLFRQLFVSALLIAFGSSQTFGQAIQFGGIKANFGIDADISANRLQATSGTPGGTDDWFKLSGFTGSGVGVIDTTGAAALYAFYNVPANINNTFIRRTPYSYYGTANSRLMLDGVFLRDHFGGTNAAGNFSDATMYAIASKNGEPPSWWHPGTGNVANKNDILDCFAHLRRNGTNVTDPMYLYTGLTLNSNTGARYVDFEFFQKPVTYTATPAPAFSDGGATEEGHTAFLFDALGKFTRAGDLIFAIELGSSGVQTFDVRIWMSRALYNQYRTSPPVGRSVDFGPNFDGAGNGSLYGYAQIFPKGGGPFDAAGILVSATTAAPPWGATFEGVNGTQYASQQFAEVALNITQLGIDPLAINASADPCQRTFFKFMSKSRASNAFTAQLQDFTAPVDFGGPPSVTTSLTSSNVISCINTSSTLSASVTPAVSGYYYTWTLPGGSTQTGVDLTSISANAPGTYTLSVSPILGCNSFTTATITVVQDNATPAAPTGVQNKEYCAGSTIPSISVASPGAGLVVRWYNMATGGTVLATGTSYTPSSPGTYYAEIYKSTTGCVSSRVAVTLTQNSVPTATTTTTRPCVGTSNGSATVIPSGGTSGYTYLWSNSLTTATISNLIAGTYNVTVTDSKTCTVVTSAVVPAGLPIVASVVSTAVSCNGGMDGQLDLTATGGNTPLTFSWGSGVTTEDRTGLAAGNYTVTITDAIGCTQTVSTSVYQPEILDVTGAITNVRCNGAATGEINITPVGGTAPYTYAWSIGSTAEDISGKTAGTYSVTVTDTKGCTDTYAGTITQPTLLTASAVPGAVTCYEESTGSVNLTASGGTTSYSYTWSNGAMTEDISALPANTYTVTVTDANQCTATASAVVSQPSAALSASATATNILCNGASTGAVDLTVSGGTIGSGYTYAWSNSATTQDLSSLPAGTYQVTVTDANACTVIVSQVVTQPQPLVLTASVIHAACASGTDGSIDLSVSGGTMAYSYSWSNGATTQDITGLAPGIYTVTVTDANGCTKSLTVQVRFGRDVPSAPAAIKY
ncbi:MAG: SprB repeat-containing protein [Bacteroidota bacterium]